MNSELNYNRFNHNLEQNESIYYEASMTARGMFILASWRLGFSLLIWIITIVFVLAVFRCIKALILGIKDQGLALLTDAEPTRGRAYQETRPVRFDSNHQQRNHGCRQSRSNNSNSRSGGWNLPLYLTSERENENTLPSPLRSSHNLPPLNNRDYMNTTRPNTGASDIPDEREYMPPGAMVPISAANIPSSPPAYSSICIPEDVDMALPSYDSLYPGKEDNTRPSQDRNQPA